MSKVTEEKKDFKEKLEAFAENLATKVKECIVGEVEKLLDDTIHGTPEVNPDGLVSEIIGALQHHNVIPEGYYDDDNEACEDCGEVPEAPVSGETAAPADGGLPLGTV